MRNNTIKMHLALHIMEDILDHGVPDVVNSSYAESAHIPLEKNTSRNTQKRVASFTRQAAHRYHEDLAILVASGDVEFEANMPVSIYLIDVESIFAPTVGIPDFGNNDSDKYLFAPVPTRKRGMAIGMGSFCTVLLRGHGGGNLGA
jgi:hypothetical protein